VSTETHECDQIQRGWVIGQTYSKSCWFISAPINAVFAEFDDKQKLVFSCATTHLGCQSDFSLCVESNRKALKKN